MPPAATWRTMRSFSAKSSVRPASAIRSSRLVITVGVTSARPVRSSRLARWRYALNHPACRFAHDTTPNLRLVALATDFVYVVRYGILDWGPTFLKQARGVELEEAGWTVAAFEAAGIVGMISSGWITDRVFGGRGARACLFYMMGCGAALAVFWMWPSDSRVVNAGVLCVGRCRRGCIGSRLLLCLYVCLYAC